MSGDVEEVLENVGLASWAGRDEEAIEGGESNRDVVALSVEREERSAVKAGTKRKKRVNLV